MRISTSKPVVLPRSVFLILLIAISLVGTGIILYSTTWGAALSDDSFYYISSARDVLAGRGFDLVPNFPPVFPLLLSLIGVFRIDPLISIRWLNALLFGVNIFLLAQIVYALTRSKGFSLLGAAFTLVSSTLIMVHSWAMSESLFICLVLSGILVYAVNQESQSWKIPFFTGLLFGLSAATRYIGISLLLAGGIFWLFETGKNFRNRAQNALVFGVIGVLPLLLWTVRNQLISGQSTNRVFGLHLMPMSMWINMLNTILLWVLPGRLVHGKELYWLAGCFVLVVVAISVYLIRRHGSPEPLAVQTGSSKPIILLSMSIISYLVILVISRSFFDIRIPMDERLLSPLLVMGMILLMWILAKVWGYHRQLAYAIVIVFCLVIAVTNLTRSVDMVQSYHELGRGYASARDHISETYAYLRNRPDNPIFSNAFAGIYFWTGRVTQSLPQPTEVQAMKDEMKRTGAYLVIFDSIPVELYGMSRDELTTGLVEQIRLSEATIYRAP